MAIIFVVYLRICVVFLALSEICCGVVFLQQMSSAIEEKNTLTETHEISKKELQAVVTRLEEQLKEQESSEITLKAEIETLKDEISQMSVLQNRVKELEEQLVDYKQVAISHTRTFFYFFSSITSIE